MLPAPAAAAEAVQTKTAEVGKPLTRELGAASPAPTAERPPHGAPLPRRPHGPAGSRAGPAPPAGPCGASGCRRGRDERRPRGSDPGQAALAPARPARPRYPAPVPGLAAPEGRRPRLGPRGGSGGCPRPGRRPSLPRWCPAQGPGRRLLLRLRRLLLPMPGARRRRAAGLGGSCEAGLPQLFPGSCLPRLPGPGCLSARRPAPARPRRHGPEQLGQARRPLRSRTRLSRPPIASRWSLPERSGWRRCGPAPRERAPGTCAAGGRGRDRRAPGGDNRQRSECGPAVPSSALPPAAAGGDAAVTGAQSKTARALVRSVKHLNFIGCHLTF